MNLYHLSFFEALENDRGDIYTNLGTRTSSLGNSQYSPGPTSTQCISLIIVLRTLQAVHASNDGQHYKYVPERVRLAPDIESSGINRFGDLCLDARLAVVQWGDKCTGLKHIASSQQKSPFKDVVRDADSDEIRRSPKIPGMADRSKSEETRGDTAG